jgi:hypothetical protein
MDSKLNKKQMVLVNQFLEFTCTKNKKLAANILKDVSWKVDQAVEVFYTNYAGSEEAMEVDEPPPKVVAPVSNSTARGKAYKKSYPINFSSPQSCINYIT